MNDFWAKVSLWNMLNMLLSAVGLRYIENEAITNVLTYTMAGGMIFLGVLILVCLWNETP